MSDSLQYIGPDKKEKKIFLIYQEILKGAVAKHIHMTKGLLIYDFATAPF
jgi:hypothetical protein